MISAAEQGMGYPDCRVGSSEKMQFSFEVEMAPDCRVGSSESGRAPDAQAVLPDCRVGSSESL